MYWLGHTAHTALAEMHLQVALQAAGATAVLQCWRTPWFCKVQPDVQRGPGYVHERPSEYCGQIAAVF
jgi:hypothetical protein